MNTDNIYTQTLQAPWLHQANVHLDVLRLDVLHPVVSGNKWFKLKRYINDAKSNQRHTIATFGGAFSNHIIAAAYYCRQEGLQSVGFIRGEAATVPSPTLQHAEALGMRLVYLSREQYRQKDGVMRDPGNSNWYFINEGGYGELGAQGASEILNYAGDDYTHIICSAGTGTMLAGLVMAAGSAVNVIGISSMKGNNDLEAAVKKLLPGSDGAKHFAILHDYHFGGYAKHPPPLIAFINQAWQQFQLPLDIVYTGKLFFAVVDLVTKKYFAEGSKLLMIHSGGLQGNASLKPNQLSFS